MAHCNQCGFDWKARVERPRTCTRCKRYDWDEPKKGAGNEIGDGDISGLRGGLHSEGGGGRGAAPAMVASGIGGKSKPNVRFSTPSDSDSTPEPTLGKSEKMKYDALKKLVISHNAAMKNTSGFNGDPVISCSACGSIGGMHQKGCSKR